MMFKSNIKNILKQFKVTNEIGVGFVASNATKAVKGIIKR